MSNVKGIALKTNDQVQPGARANMNASLGAGGRILAISVGEGAKIVGVLAGNGKVDVAAGEDLAEGLERLGALPAQSYAIVVVDNVGDAPAVLTGDLSLAESDAPAPAAGKAITKASRKTDDVENFDAKSDQPVEVNVLSARGSTRVDQEIDVAPQSTLGSIEAVEALPLQATETIDGRNGVSHAYSFAEASSAVVVDAPSAAIIGTRSPVSEVSYASAITVHR